MFNVLTAENLVVVYVVQLVPRLCHRLNWLCVCVCVCWCLPLCSPSHSLCALLHHPFTRPFSEAAKRTAAVARAARGTAARRRPTRRAGPRTTIRRRLEEAVRCYASGAACAWRVVCLFV